MRSCRNKGTKRSEGYGFVEFEDHATAERILTSLNGHRVPETTQVWRLNWASFGIRESCGGPAEVANTPAEEFSIFVGDLSSTVTDVVLLDTFRSSFGSAKSAKVIVDDSGVSKGYGFVRFGDKRERDLAMMEMNGKVCHQRIMRISSATTKKGAGRTSGARRTGRGATGGA